MEAELLREIGLCFGNAEVAAEGIPEKVFRAINPEQANSDRDKAARARDKQRLLEQIIPFREVELTSVIPGFGPHPTVPLEEQVAVRVKADHLHQVIEKLIRGFTFVFGGAYIEPDHQIVIRLESETELSFLAAVVAKFATQHAIGPGIVVSRAVPPEDPASGVFKVTIWGRFTFWAVVGPA